MCECDSALTHGHYARGGVPPRSHAPGCRAPVQIAYDHGAFMVFGYVLSLHGTYIARVRSIYHTYGTSCAAARCALGVGAPGQSAPLRTSSRGTGLTKYIVS
uniref:Uncharacterized protein n=1 Tax=Knipowitschia caucasica TaxID=637954 RepID=A0AAV2L6T3_KNICA